MLVSWDWLSQYLKLDMPVAEFERRLTMAGLNHEETKQVGRDYCINLEVTSNRPDCLGHIGIAREAAVLFDRPLTLPKSQPKEGSTPASELVRVRIECLDHCPRYIARVVRGVKVASSPGWLAARLATIGIPTINNVVDITNYVLMECGQPLHAFDLAKLAGHEIIVRTARAGEQFLAINHKTYELNATSCVIADAQRSVAVAGVMGGAETEVGPQTKDVLIESAAFSPMSIRATARKLNLHSDSSYRFERALDPEGVDWASRRCCELILELCGGELAAGSVDAGQQPQPRSSITLRFNQLQRILGIEIPTAETRRIMTALGCREVASDLQKVEVIPPSWRSDISREIDLVEEVARIHGYDAIPENVQVPMATSYRTTEDRVLGKVRHVLSAAGFDEALTLSAVEEPWSDAFSPWTKAAPLRCYVPVLRRAELLRRSLVPSLLGARRTNESLANPVIELFEIAKAYLPRAGQLPEEPLLLALTSGAGYVDVKGALEAVVAELNPAAEVVVQPTAQPLLESDRASELWLARPGQAAVLWGYLGEVSQAGLKKFELRSPTTVAEVRVDVLAAAAQLVPQMTSIPQFPAIERDLNLVMDEAVQWATLAGTVTTSAAPLAEQIELVDIYRDEKQLGPGKKSLLVRLTLRSHDTTLTSDEADQVRERIVAACREKHSAELRAS